MAPREQALVARLLGDRLIAAGGGGPQNVDVLDRVGSGDAFAAGVIYGLLRELPIEIGLNLGVANAAYALASVGDGSAATLNEIERLAAGGGSNVTR
jgi:2-dehydro-3-deoxygluconokinase